MDSIVIKGGKPLIGEIKISGAKNASLPLMVAALLTDQPLTLSNIPKLSDINTMKSLLQNHGVEINNFETEDSSTLVLSADQITSYTAPYEIVRKMRASIWVLGPLLARFGRAKVSLPGGCAIGARQVDLHLAAMEALGAKISIEDGYIIAEASNGLKSCKFTFDKQSVGATINAILAAVLAEGESEFHNCAIEPEIIDLCHCLQSMGASIFGVGSRSLTIKGVSKLEAAKHKVLPDRIEAGSYMIATAATKGDVLLKNIDLSILDNLIVPLRNSGSTIQQEEGGVRVKHSGPIKPININTAPYPGFSTDLQAQFMTLMTLSEGEAEIEENLFENRFMHVPELCRMGANINIQSNKAIVKGVDYLKGAEVMASDLRASVSLVIAGLVAHGETKVRRIYHLDRGYQDLELKLRACGADIIRVAGDSV